MAGSSFGCRRAAGPALVGRRGTTLKPRLDLSKQRPQRRHAEFPLAATRAIVQTGGTGRLDRYHRTFDMVELPDDTGLAGFSVRQILYVSHSTAAAGKADLDAILERSRHNNALDGLTGLLWSDGTRFLQVVEGPQASVAAVFERILTDPRHDRIEVLRDCAIAEREFGSWAMARRERHDTADAFDMKIRRDLSRASPGIRDAFLDLVSTHADE